MNARIGSLICSALLMAAPLTLRAQAAAPAPDLSMPNDEFFQYVGHYGEVLKLRTGWEIQASMHGETEVINYHSRSRIAFSDSIDRFNPKPEDFVAENFTRYALIQLIIMPWSEASSKSLEELKQLKIKDLQSSGVGFEVFDEPHFPEIYGRWPQGSFEVWVSTPYRLSQLYTASASHLCILSSGRDTPPSTVISHYYYWMRSSLARWLVPQTKVDELLNPKPLTPRQIVAEGISLRPFSKPDIWKAWVAVSGICLLLIGILSITKRWEPLRRAALSLLVFAHAGALIGGAVGLVFWPFEWFARHLPISSAVACLFAPLLALLIGRIRMVRPRRRALIALVIWAAGASAFLAYCGWWDWGTGFSSTLPALTAIYMFVFYAVAGGVFGILDGNSNSGSDRRALLVIALLFAVAPKIWAQTAPVPIEKSRPNQIEGDASFIARNKLTARGVTPDSLRTDAEVNLKKSMPIYKYQRVEIKGIWAKEDTRDDKRMRSLFDKQIEPSHIGDSDSSRVIQLPEWMQTARNYSKDLRELHRDAYQQISKTATKAVEDLRGQEVNEIVAHSWGTEIVYNAILTGNIRPPRRLIVAGMPDRDIEKWKALSRHTGTEVVVYTNTSDPAAGAARLIGDVLDASERSSEKLARERIERTIGSPDYEADWAAACRKFDCNPHARQAPPTIYNRDYKGATHSRLAYYGAMLDDGTIPAAQANAYLLAENQKSLIDAESKRLYAVELAKERESISGQNALRAGGEASFLQGIGQIGKIGQISQQTRDTFAAQEAAAYARWKSDPEYVAYRAKTDEWARQGKEYRRLEEEANQRSREVEEGEQRRKARHWADMKTRWNYLRELTGLACSNPDALEEQARLGKVPGVSITDLDLAWEMERLETISFKTRPVANECQKYILKAIGDSNSLVSGQTLLSWARRYRKEHPTLLGRFTTTIGDFFSAMGDAFHSEGGGTYTPQLDGSEYESRESKSRPIETERPSTPERPTRHSPDNWESLRQLRGFKGF